MPVYPLRHIESKITAAGPILREAGYPETVPCILCGKVFEQDEFIDWWLEKGNSGPCHDGGSCREGRA